jgi:hypothetical protein
MMESRVLSVAKTSSFWTLLLILAAGFSYLVGCSSRPEGGGRVPPAFNELQEVNDLLRRGASRDRAPAKLEDLSRFKGSYPRGYEAVQSGKIEVIWGTQLKGEEDVGKDETVLAYEKDAPTQGGYVLLSAGTIKKMSAGEFQSAPKHK